MKKAFVQGFTGLFLAWTITNVTYSQSSTSTAKLKPQLTLEKNVPISKQLNSAKNSNFLLRNEINAKAVRNFTREYKNITGAKWFKSANGLFAVYFISEKIQSWVYYNTKGNYEFMIRHYYEEKLPREVRHLVKSNYYDFSIYHVTEVSRNDKIAYVLKLEDKTSWKTIKVVDGEMEVTEGYLKSKG
jgi:hypothetical protein